MKIDLARLINVEKNSYTIISAIFHQKENLLEIKIKSENPLDSSLEEDLREYFSYVDLKISYEKIIVTTYDDYIPEYEGEVEYEDVPDDLNNIVFRDEKNSYPASGEDVKNEPGPKVGENESELRSVVENDQPTPDTDDKDLEVFDPSQDDPFNEEDFAEEKQNLGENEDSTEEALIAENLEEKDLEEEGQEEEKSSFDDLKKAKEAQLQRKIAQALNYQNKQKEKEDAQKNTDGLNFGRKIKADPNKFLQLSSKHGMAKAHGAIKILASDLLKIAEDIRFLSSGPRTGIGELIIPSNEPGSSIMPGKVNPTQVEMLAMICLEVMANDQAITMANALGQLELNAYMPFILYKMVDSVKILSKGLHSFNIHLVKGLVANEEKIAENLNKSLMLVTALSPHIGYDKASDLAKFAHKNKISLREANAKLVYVTDEEFIKIVDPEKMV